MEFVLESSEYFLIKVCELLSLLLFLPQRRHYAKEDDHCKQAMEKFFASMDKRLIRSGRLCEVLDDEIANVLGFEATDNLTWIKVRSNAVSLFIANTFHF